MKLRALGVLAFTFLLSNCGGGHGGGPSGPTEPSAPKNILVVDVVLVPQSSGGLQEALLTLDGKQLIHVDWSNGTGGYCQSDCHLPAVVNNVSTGPHTVEATVVRQTRARISYVTVGSVSFGDNSGNAHQIDLPSKIVTLGAGDKLTYPINL